ncbi:MAG: hypothetical protein ACKOHG_15275 [Planctomycetia bacterium]
MNFQPADGTTRTVVTTVIERPDGRPPNAGFKPVIQVQQRLAEIATMPGKRLLDIDRADQATVPKARFRKAADN